MDVIRSAKMEIRLADGENDDELYLSAGFALEETLASHYRHGEKVRVPRMEIP